MQPSLYFSQFPIRQTKTHGNSPMAPNPIQTRRKKERKALYPPLHTKATHTPHPPPLQGRNAQTRPFSRRRHPPPPLPSQPLQPPAPRRPKSGVSRTRI